MKAVMGIDGAGPGLNALPFAVVQGPGTHSSASSSEKSTSPPAQDFEWIAHGDATARRRARAHVTRGFRRQKAAQAGQDKPKGKSKSQEIIERRKSEEARVVIASKDQPYDEAESSNARLSLALQPSLGQRSADAYPALPIDLSPATHALLEHFLSGVVPKSFQLDTRASFQPIKALSFEVAHNSAPAFHIILSAAANDIANLQGRKISNEAVQHKGLALQCVNKAIIKQEERISDDSIAGVALLAGNELLCEDPRSFNTHMDGLQMMLNLTGGLEKLRRSNPALYSIISWFDYSGACNLVSKRRFSSVLSNTSGVPQIIISSLPDRYDLMKFVSYIFQGLNTINTAVQINSTVPQTVPETADSASFITTVDSELYRSVCIPDQEGNRSRRRHLMQTYQLLALIYTSAISISSGSDAETSFLRTTHEVYEFAPGWALSILSIFTFIFSAYKIEKDDLEQEITKVIEASFELRWDDWWSIKKALLNFLLNDEVCKGPMQELWKRRIEILGS